MGATKKSYTFPMITEASRLLLNGTMQHQLCIRIDLFNIYARIQYTICHLITIMFD